MENRNAHRTTVFIPKSNISNFLEDIKSYGIITIEAVGYSANDDSRHINEIAANIENAENMLATFNELLSSATTIADKITLEKEINNIKNEMEAFRIRKKEIEARIENVTTSIRMHNQGAGADSGYAPRSSA